MVTLLREHGVPEVSLKQLSRVSPGPTGGGVKKSGGGGSHSTSTFVGARLDDTSGKDGLCKYRGCSKGISNKRRRLPQLLQVFWVPRSQTC